jgi:hypothetical protein
MLAASTSLAANSPYTTKMSTNWGYIRDSDGILMGLLGSIPQPKPPDLELFQSPTNFEVLASDCRLDIEADMIIQGTFFHTTPHSSPKLQMLDTAFSDNPSQPPMPFDMSILPYFRDQPWTF